MKLHFIGTGSGITSLKRNHSSILLSSNGHNLLIDAGDGISKALLSQEIKYNSIHSILLTHFHPDHLGGIASLIAQMKLSDRTEPLTIYTNNKLVESLENYLNINYLFAENLGFKFEIAGFNENETITVSNELQITARQNSHIKPKDDLKNYGQIKFVSNSFCFLAENNKIIYTSDIGSKEDLYLFKEISADYFIVESTHVSLKEIYDAYDILKPGWLFLTHIEDADENKIEQFISESILNKYENIKAAYDNLIIKA